MQEPSPNQANANPVEKSSEQTASKLLSQLLEGALAHKKRALSHDEWAALRAVTQRFEGSLDPFEEVATALVEALLSTRWKNSLNSPDTISRLSSTIARTLCSDPMARQRLLEFQQLLNGQT